jgi:phosphoglycolate phosphatase
MITKRFSVQLFDLDGTLVDSLPGISHSFSRALNLVLPHATLPNIRPFIGPPIREIFQRALNGAANSQDLDALELEFRRSYDADGWQLSVPYPGVIDGITALVNSGVDCYVVTNKPAIPTHRILNHFGLSALFQEVVTRESRTPHFTSKREATRDLANRLSGPRSQILFIGDSTDDAEAAKACGFRFAAADYGFGNVSQYMPDQIDFNLPDFTSILSIGV